MTAIYAQLETRHWRFDVIAIDQPTAERLMITAWGRHQMQTGARDSWADVADSVQYRPLLFGQVYRDGNPL